MLSVALVYSPIKVRSFHILQVELFSGVLSPCLLCRFKLLFFSKATKKKQAKKGGTETERRNGRKEGRKEEIKMEQEKGRERKRIVC